VQVPPFWHGPDKQSSILVWHFVPLKPVPVQLHLKSLTKSVQEPPFWHGLDAQSSILLLHVDPSYPAIHWHVYAKCHGLFENVQVNVNNNKKILQLIPSVQVPPFKHGFGEQSSILVWHFAPLNPVPVQLHVYVLIPSIHWPPFLHGFGKQSLILLSQFVPLNPETHWQVYAII